MNLELQFLSKPRIRLDFTQSEAALHLDPVGVVLFASSRVFGNGYEPQFPAPRFACQVAAQDLAEYSVGFLKHEPVSAWNH